MHITTFNLLCICLFSVSLNCFDHRLYGVAISGMVKDCKSRVDFQLFKNVLLSGSYTFGVLESRG